MSPNGPSARTQATLALTSLRIAFTEVYLPKLKFALGALFVATFFATRVAFAPIYSYAAFVRGFDSLVSLHPFLRSVAFVTIAAPPILNTFWGFFILQKACGELKKEKKDKEE